MNPTVTAAGSALDRSGGNPEAVELELRASERAPGEARDALVRFQELLSGEAYCDVRLLVSELIADCLRDNGRTPGRPIKLSARIEGSALRLEISDDDDRFEVPDSRPEPGGRGFGLYLTTRLADHWGIERGQDRTTVWLELGLG